jgi:hypothetical protein
MVSGFDPVLSKVETQIQFPKWFQKSDLVVLSLQTGYLPNTGMYLSFFFYLQQKGT